MPLGRGGNKGRKDVGVSSKMGTNKTILSEKNSDMKKCGTFPHIREHWTWGGHKTLQKHRNDNVKRGYKALSTRTFAELYRLSHRRL